MSHSRFLREDICSPARVQYFLFKQQGSSFSVGPDTMFVAGIRTWKENVTVALI